MPTSRSRTARRYVVEDVCDAGATESFADSMQDSQASNPVEIRFKAVGVHKRRTAASVAAFLDYHCPPELP